MQANHETARPIRAKAVQWSFLNGISGVYFVGDAGLVKIGWSNDIGARLRNMETGRATSLEFFGVIEDAGREIEAEFHSTYAAYRVRGEWFRLEGRLLEVLWPTISGEDWELQD